MSTPRFTIAGRYEILDRIGQGGMGSLYRARDPILDRVVAIKLLRDGFDDEELRERFVREARAAARLTHRHIVTIHDFGEQLGQPYIVMEFVAGETLAQIIGRQTPMSLVRKLELIEELCVGLAFAHRAGVVHRDIKPANVILDSEGVLKILDFGIARLGDSSMTKGGMLGTLNYIAPEQIQGRADARSDIFSVGALFYELLTYRLAFLGGFDSGVLSRIINDPPEPLSSVCPGLDPQIERIVMRALEKDPAKRYQDLTILQRDVVLVREHLEAAAEAAPETIVLGTRKGAKGKSAAVGPVPSPAPAAADRPTRRSSRAVSEAPESEIAAMLVASRGALAAHDLDKALVTCEQVLAINPANTSARTLLDEIRGALEARRVRALADVVRGRLDEGALTSAAAVLGDLIALAPGSKEAQTLGAELARRRAERAAGDAPVVATGARPLPEPVSPTTRPLPRLGLIPAVTVALLLVVAAALWVGRTEAPSPTGEVATVATGAEAPPTAAAPVLVGVRVDAIPWARVRIRPTAGQAPVPDAPQVTPFTLDLPPGEYELNLENGGLTSPATERIKVVAKQPADVRITMPGFSPDRLVSALLGPESRP